MRPDGHGGEKLRHHIGEVGKVVKTVRIEPKRAKDLNRTWETRQIIYWEEDQPLPDSLKRSPGEDEQGDFKWKEEKMVNGQWSAINGQ